MALQCFLSCCFSSCSVVKCLTKLTQVSVHYTAYPIALISLELIVCKDETMNYRTCMAVYGRAGLDDLCCTPCSCVSYHNELVVLHIPLSA